MVRGNSREESGYPHALQLARGNLRLLCCCVNDKLCGAYQKVQAKPWYGTFDATGDEQILVRRADG